jgi:hypothetical protein
MNEGGFIKIVVAFSSLQSACNIIPSICMKNTKNWANFISGSIIKNFQHVPVSVQIRKIIDTLHEDLHLFLHTFLE